MEEIKDSSHYFYARDGNILKNMGDLLTFLENADDGTFSHHFNKEKNDFANWTDGTLKNHSLARKMYSTKTREEMHNLVKKEIEKSLHPTPKKKSIISEIKEAFSR